MCLVSKYKVMRFEVLPHEHLVCNSVLLVSLNRGAGDLEGLWDQRCWSAY